MSYFNLKFRVDFLGHVKNVMINILFFTVYYVGTIVLYSVSVVHTYVHIHTHIYLHMYKLHYTYKLYKYYISFKYFRKFNFLFPACMYPTFVFTALEIYNPCMVLGLLLIP